MKLTHLVIAAVAAAGGWIAAVSFHGGSRAALTPVAETNRAAVPGQCPMHPWIKSNKPDRCTVCGMNLVAGRDPLCGVMVGSSHDAGASSAKLPGDLVLLTAASSTVIGVQTDEVRSRPLVRTLRVAGMIGEDETRHGVISAPVEGRIDGLAMSCEGEKITRRQPLATIFSRTLLAAANDYKSALKQKPAAIDEVKKRLLQHGLVTEQINAIPQRQDDDIHFGILAPLTGTITKSFVAEGQYVKEGEKLFEIADFRKMWFMFVAYEADLPFIHVGQVVNVSTPSIPDSVTKARVAFVSPNLDEMTRSARVRVVLENPDGRFRNKTFAQGVIELDAPELLTVTRSAVLRPGDSARVYVETAPGHYQQRLVKLGRIGDAHCEVLEGLKAGERVVTTGNLLLDAQAQLDHFANLPSL